MAAPDVDNGEENWDPISDDELDPVWQELVNVDDPNGPTSSVDSGFAEEDISLAFDGDSAVETFVQFTADERWQFELFLKFSLHYGYYL
jgi:hypothetical protein